MKRLIWLLAMYVLVLTGLPCPDSDCRDLSTPAATQSSHTDDDHQSPCSPFCHCATCTGFTTPQPLVGTPPTPPSRLLTRSAFAYQPIRHDDVSGSFWQPPKY